MRGERRHDESKYLRLPFRLATEIALLLLSLLLLSVAAVVDGINKYELHYIYRWHSLDGRFCFKRDLYVVEMHQIGNLAVLARERRAP